MNKEDTKQAILGFTEFFKGVTGNQDLKIPDDIAKEYEIKPNKWIPVSERLPEDNILVLVTVKVGNREPKVRSGYYYMNGHFHIDNGDCWEARDKELIAWMPLPEPYQPEIPTGSEGSEE